MYEARMQGPFPKTAAWVAAILKSSGLSQEAFAEKAELSRSGLTKWLAGLQQPRYESIQKLRKVAPPHLQDPESWTATPPRPPQVVDTSQMSDPHATSSGTPAVKGTHGQDLLELDLAGREGIISDALYDVLKETIGNLRGAATSPEGARKTIDGFIAVYTAGLRRRGNR